MSGAIKKALGNLEEIVPAGADGSYYQGQHIRHVRQNGFRPILPTGNVLLQQCLFMICLEEVFIVSE